MLNRLFTPKEQWLLAGASVALAVGAGTIWFNTSQTVREAALGILPAEETSPPQKEALADIGFPHLEIDESPVARAPVVPYLVAVAGAVRHEGLYTLPPDARVLDLLEAAGGAQEGAHLEAVNRAARLLDGATLTVPWTDYTQAEGEEEQYRRWSAGVYLNPPEYLHNPWSQQVRAQYEQTAVATAAHRTAGGTPAQSVGHAPASVPGCINLNTATLRELETLPGIGPVIGQRILDYRDQIGFRDIAELMNVSGIAEKRFAAIAHLVCL